ncbi:hypothetical protein GCM10010430_51660 [Kitasatospora cystarginea]|uniref:Uncharacterized protein n=1 Tax=Kitasatospora cystarginea TaxID=58350 RepID=A0ABP5RGH4_9ACTN
MTETRGTGPAWTGEPLVTATTQPDWAALAERHEQEVRRRKQIRVVAAGVAATAAIGGIIATVVQISGSEGNAAHPAASGVNRVDGAHSPSVDANASTPAAPTEGASPSAQASASVSASGTPSTAASRPATPTAAAPAAPTAPSPSDSPGSKGRPTPPPAAANPYNAGQVCGSGYKVVDSHGLGGASVYLLFNDATGNNCVVTIPDHPGGAVPMNATLAVQGGASAGNPGSFTYYAGPVTEHAPKNCVRWGGSYQGNNWSSGWSHCG